MKEVSKYPDNNVEWNEQIHVPMFRAVRTVDKLSAWSVAAGGFMFGWWGWAIGNIPALYYTKSVYLGIEIAITVTSPLNLLFVPIGISSECNDLMRRLNRLRFHGNAAHKDRAGHLYYTIHELN